MERMFRERREERREQGERGKEKAHNRETTVFVDNLPLNLDKYGLKGIFSKAGRVSDVYIPMRVGRRSGRRFGFVRYWREDEAIRSIRLFNNYSIRGRKVNVCEAKFGKGRQGTTKSTQPTSNYEQSTKRVWRRKWSQDREKVAAISPRLSQEDDSIIQHLKGEICDNNLDWLGRSLVCSTDKPSDLCALAATLNVGFPQYTKIRALSKFKFILTFQSTQEMEDILEKPTELEQWFTNIKQWDIYDTSDTRRTWIEVFGVPPHGWKWENFKRIAELWGSFVCLGSDVDNPESLESMTILIDTNQFNNIDGGFVLDLEDCGYRVKVREVQHVYKNLDQNHNKKANSDVFWPGFEDLSPDTVVAPHEEEMNLDVSNPTSRCNQEEDQGNQLDIQNSNRGGDEQARVESGLVSSSKTESADFLGTRDQLIRPGEGSNDQRFNEGSTDSEATIGNSLPTQPNYFEFPPRDTRELGYCESLFDMDDDFQVIPRRSLKSKVKKKKFLKEKCIKIQKKIMKKPLTKSHRQTQKKAIVCDSFIEEARRAWETTKAVGLATKGDDEEVVARIARNLAEEAEERKARGRE